MNLIIRSILIIIVLNGCEWQGKSQELESIIKPWTNKNIRISNNFEINSKKSDHLRIILKENSSVGSPIVEEISSANLVSKIIKSYDLPEIIDTITVVFDLPKNIATYGKMKKKVYTYYSYPKERWPYLLSIFSYNSVRKVSDYITFKMKNKDEHEFLQSANLTNEMFDWYKLKDQSGLELICEYSILSNSKEISHPNIYTISLAALYAVSKEANIDAIDHLDSLFTIIGNIPSDLHIREIDSLGRNMALLHE